MILTFDSSVLIDLENGRRETLERVKDLIKMHPDPSPILFIPYFEFYFGIQDRSPKNIEKAYSFLQKFRIVQPTKTTAELLSALRRKYDAKGVALTLADLLIASQVHEHNLLLVTRDKDFSKIEEIKKVIY